MKLFNLQKYAFTKNFFEERGYLDTQNAKPTQNAKATQNAKSTQRMSNQNTNKVNSVFWAFFCILKGDDEYHLHQNNLFKIKNEFSMKFVETLKKEKVFMKENKIRFHDVESSLLYDKDINLTTLRAMALFYKINLLFIINNRYYVIENEITDENEQLYLIQQNKYKITYELINTEDKSNKTRGKLFMDGTRTTLKAPGTYKLDELKEYCNILGINVLTHDSKKKTKQQLYDDIIIKID